MAQRLKAGQDNVTTNQFESRSSVETSHQPAVKRAVRIKQQMQHLLIPAIQTNSAPAASESSAAESSSRKGANKKEG